MKVRVPNSGANMANMIKKMQDDMATLQADLEAREYDVSAGGGVVNIKINGKREIVSIDIKPEIVDPDDIETLSDILVAGVNQAIKLVDDTTNNEMGKITGQLGSMPGMPNLF